MSEMSEAYPERVSIKHRQINCECDEGEKMRKSIFILASLGILFCGPTFAEDVFRIEVGRDYNHYSNDELRRRVWELERAVSQLQSRVFQLEVNESRPQKNPWTCTIQSFGKTHVSNADTKASALAKVLKKCSDATNAVHCHESDVKCDNE